MEFPFYIIECQMEFEFVDNSRCPSCPANHHRKMTEPSDKVRSFTKTISSKSLEIKLSNAWKLVRIKSSERRYRLRNLEDKFNDARTKNTALEKKIGKKDAQIYELKTDLQSMVDRLKVKECQLNFIHLAPPVLCVQAS